MGGVTTCANAGSRSGRIIGNRIASVSAVAFTRNASAVAQGLFGDPTSILSNILCLLQALLSRVVRSALIGVLDTAMAAVFATFRENKQGTLLARAESEYSLRAAF